MEVALIPGVLALGESIACHLMYAAVELESNSSRGQPAPNTSRSHAGIYCNPKSDADQSRPHSGIYCNPALRQHNLPAVAEKRLYNAEPDESHPQSLSSLSGSETDRFYSTARLMLPPQVSTQASEAAGPVSPHFGTHSDYLSHSACTRSLLMPTQEQLHPSASRSLFSMSTQAYRPAETALDASSLDQTMVKPSAGLASLPPFSSKNTSSASNSTSSTCSDLDTSGTSTVSFNLSNASEVQSPRSVCQDAEFLQLDSPREREPQTRIPFGASLVDQRDVSLVKAPVSKARSFCHQAFADCGLDNLEDEMADVKKDLENLRVSMATSKRSRYLLNFDDK